MTNREIIAEFLGAYQRHDYDGMQRHLDPRAEFSDMAFPLIAGDRVRAMWRWFCARTTERDAIDVPNFVIAAEEGEEVLAFYRVRYKLPDAPGPIDYWIRAAFLLREGKIVRQVDASTVSDYEFARMATRSPKPLLAAVASPLFRWGVRTKMRVALDRAMTTPRPAVTTKTA